MTRTTTRGISFDERDKLYEAGFMYNGKRFRKRFKLYEDAKRWLEEIRQTIYQRINDYRNADIPYNNDFLIGHVIPN